MVDINIEADFSEILKLFKGAIKDSDIKQREGWKDKRGVVHMVDYVEWHTDADVLDQIAPDWEWSILSITVVASLQEEPIVAITGALTITYKGKRVTRCGVGTGSSETEMGIKKAEHDALKRAAIKFGIGRHLYEKESDAIERTGSVVTRKRAKPELIAFTNPENAITKSQLGLLAYKARTIGLDLEAECLAEMGVATIDLSKNAASWFIDHLKDVEEGEKDPTYHRPVAESPNETTSPPPSIGEPDFIMEGHEKTPAGPRPFCWCDPPLPCRWVAGITKGSKENYAMWVCAKHKDDPTRCQIRLDREGKQITAKPAAPAEQKGAK